MSHTMFIPVLVACASGGLTSNLLGQRAPNEADLVLRNGKIVTMDAAKPEVEAVAVRGRLILAVGSNGEIQRFIGRSTKIIDLAGKLAVPGFIEGHGHFLGLGESKETLDLTKTKNWDEIVSKVQEAVRQGQPERWIIGWGWHQEKWDKRPNPTGEGFPTHQALSAVSPQNPVLLALASGHASVANAKAMELSCVTKKTADPAGAEIVRDCQGNPTGVFRQTAQGLIRKNQQEDRTPQQRDADRRKWASLANQECLSKGITSFQDAGSTFDDVELYQKLVSEGALGVRLWVMVRESNNRLRNLLSTHKMRAFGDHHLTVGAIKKMMDGALGSRGAWLLEPYADDPGNTGLNVESPADSAKPPSLLSNRTYSFAFILSGTVRIAKH